MKNQVREADPSDGVLGAQPGLLRGMIRGWDRFWFSPTDPTTLGLIRICAGVLMLYAHLVYSFDLQALFGEHAWLDLATADEIRKESPNINPTLGWSELEDPFRPRRVLPNDPAKNKEMAQVLEETGIDPRTLPDNMPAAEREKILAYGKKWQRNDPRLLLEKGEYRWSVWFHVTDPTWMRVIHAGVLLVLFLFTIGFCTRLTAALSLLAVLSYIHRSQPTVFGMDAIMAILLLYLTIGASGAALSVDRLLALYRATRKGRAVTAFAARFLWPEPSLSANFALRLMQVHICIIYFASGTSKLLGSTWWSGTAVWGTMANYSFSPMTFKPYVAFLIFLSEHRWLWELVMESSAVFTLVIELSFLFLVWNPRLRWVMLAGAVLLHTGIAVFMGLTMFSLMMLALLLAFVPAETVRRLLLGAARRLAAFRVPHQAEREKVESATA